MGFNIGANSGQRGIMIIKPEYRGTYNSFRISQTGCVVRLYPALNSEGNPLPLRAGQTPNDIGEWVNGNHVMLQHKGGGMPGKEKITLLLTVEGDQYQSDPAQRAGISIWEQIRGTYYNAVESGTAPQHWYRWQANNKDAVLGPQSASKPKGVAFVRGALLNYMTAKGPMQNVSADKPKLNCIFYMPPMAQQALLSLVMKQKDDHAQLTTDDWSEFFMYENQIIDLENGCPISFGRPSSTESTSPFGGNNSNVNQYAVEATVMPKKMAIPIEVVRQFCTTPLDNILQSWKSEKDLISALSVGIPDDLIIAAFKSNPAYLPEKLVKSMQAAEQKAATGNMQQPQSSFTHTAKPEEIITSAPATTSNAETFSTPPQEAPTQIEEDDIPESDGDNEQDLQAMIAALNNANN
jgi:hypothetical protein